MSKNRPWENRPVIYGKPLVISVQYDESIGDLTSELRTNPRRRSVVHIGPPYNTPNKDNHFTLERSLRYHGKKRITPEIIDMITNRAKDLAARLELPFIDERKATKHLRGKALRESRERKAKHK